MRYTAILILAFATAAGAQSGNWSTVKPGANTKPDTEWKQRLIVASCEEGDIMPIYPPRICKAGKWVEDAVQERAEAEAKQKRRTDLWNALRTRVVTDAEMAEILAEGVEIVPHQAAYMTPNQYGTLDVYYPTQNDIQAAQSLLIEALYYQFKMRLDASKACEKAVQ